MRGPSRGRRSSRSSCGRSFKGGKPRAPPACAMCIAAYITCTCHMMCMHVPWHEIATMQPIHESWHPTLTLYRRVWTGRGVNHTVSTP